MSESSLNLGMLATWLRNRRDRSSRLRLLFCVSVLVTAARWCTGADIPASGDPRRLTDLRWLARSPSGESVIIDKLSGVEDAIAADGTVADIQGPGVLQHLICAPAGDLQISVDGMDVFRGVPHDAWPRVYVAPKANDRGDLPFAFPLVHQAGLYAHCLLPIPFKDRLVIRQTGKNAQVWLMVQRLAAAPETEFSTAPESSYMARLREVQIILLRRKDVLPTTAGSEVHEFTAECRTRSTDTIADLRGPGELIGMRLHIYPGALELLRELVVALTIDGVTTVRMPLVDFVGVSHPWPHAWAPMAGDWAAGVIHPYRRSGGRVQRQVIVYSKLPVPFASELRLAVTNRSELLPVIIRGQFATVPLTDMGKPVPRLCGTSRAMELKDGRNVLHTFPAGPARLAGMSLFTTGHGRDWAWRRQSSVILTASPGGGSIAGGPGLLPLGLQGKNGNQIFGAMTWNHNSLELFGRCGAGRHFWVDPISLTGNEQLAFVLAGADGPTRGEAAVVWYHLGRNPPPAAPDVIPPRAEMLPPVHHPQSRKPSGPEGWRLEAEDLADSAEATVGMVRAETVGAKDAFASAGAYLAWNAVKPGDAMDLLVDLPLTRYVRLWYHRLLFPAGGVFKIRLAASDAPVPGLELAKSPTDFRSRVLGLKAGPASIECHGVWPHRQAYRFEMPIMHNPAPGARGRLRFICASKLSHSRSYLLAIDQLGMDAATATPEGWNEWEALKPERRDRTFTVAPMPYGRTDFHGWGGQRLTATAEGGASTFLLFDPERPTGGSALVLRGVVESGEWSVAAGTGTVTPLRATSAKEPTEWTVPLGTESNAGPQGVIVRCQSGPGSLLLDAWRHATR